MLPPVEDGPGDLTGVALQKVSLVGATGQEPGIILVNAEAHSNWFFL